MNQKNEIFDLLSLLKVFDVNYVSDEDCEVLHELDVNNPVDVSKAVNALLISEFRTYLPTAQTRLKNLLHSYLENPKEDFGALFDRVELAFDNTVSDKRAFMIAIRNSLEALGALGP